MNTDRSQSAPEAQEAITLMPTRPNQSESHAVSKVRSGSLASSRTGSRTASLTGSVKSSRGGSAVGARSVGNMVKKAGTRVAASSAAAAQLAESASSNSPAMKDVQSASDNRNIAIDRVGVKDVTYPIRLRTKDGGEQTTVASINMYVALPHHQKGTHMSRFLEVLNDETSEPLTPDRIPAITRAICERLNAEEAHFEAEFTYFVRKLAPISKRPGLMDYRVKFACTANGKEDFIMSVAAPATSLCPCSKEISEFGAHNQRCRIEAAVRFKDMVWIEDLVEILEKAASCPVYAVLKRPDEKFVTEQAYLNPKFVEDIVRDLALALEGEKKIEWFSINSENFESIHSHNAYAQITRDKR